jgi:hypothetical protein
VTDTARATLEYIAKEIVEDPDSVEIEAEEQRNGVRLTLHVGPGDVGRVIGRRGRVVQAIRTVVRVAGARDGGNVSVEVAD